MKTIIKGLLLIFGLPLISNAQKESSRIFVSADLIPFHSKLPGYGFGITLGGEYFFSSKGSFSYNISYEHFTGYAVNVFTYDTTRNINLMPVLFGLNFYPKKIIHIGLQVGIVKPFTEKASLLPAIAPEMGFTIPGTKDKINITFQLVRIIGLPSFPENSYLIRGGYNFSGFHLRYHF